MLTWTGGAHTVGETYGGGIVFYVTTDGLHGLIAETQDQAVTTTTWYNAQDIISTASSHSATGKLFTDWRLPTKNELGLLYSKRVTVGGFTNTTYWSSTENDSTTAWTQDFSNANKASSTKTSTLSVRAIRAF
jgi:hypothetical protein